MLSIIVWTRIALRLFRVKVLLGVTNQFLLSVKETIGKRHLFLLGLHGTKKLVLPKPKLRNHPLAMHWFFLSLIIIAAGLNSVQAKPPIKVAILIFGDSGTAIETAEKLSLMLKSKPELEVLDRDQSRTAARG